MPSYEDAPSKGTESDKTTKSYPSQGKKASYDKCTGVNKAKAADQVTEERVNCDATE